MAIVSLGGPFYFGWDLATSISRVDLTIDAAGEKVAFVFRVPKTGDIDRVSFRVQAVTSSQTLRVSLETVDGSGNPSGTDYGGSAPGTQTSPAVGTSYEVTLATPASATEGDYIAAVIQFDSSVGNLAISQGSISANVAGSSYPVHYTASWAKQARQPMLSIRYDDGTYGFISAIPPCLFSSAGFNTGSTPDERANKFILPAPLQVCGMYAYINAGNTMDMVLYDSGGTALETVSNDPNSRQSAAQLYTLFPFAPRDLTAGTYYVAVKPTSGSNITAYWVELLATGHLAGLHGGTNIHYASRTDAGSWNDNTSLRLKAGLVVSGVDAGGGGGSGIPGNLLGGMFQ